MSYSGKLAAHYQELAAKPVSAESFAGEDIRYSPEFEALENELGKAASLHTSAPIDWQMIREQSETLLRAQSKDLRAAAWLTWALYQCESFQGLHAGLALLLHLCEEHWDDLHPRKSRTRAAALTWLTTRLEPAFDEAVPIKEQLPLFRDLASALARLDQCLSQRLESDAPLLLPLCRRLNERVNQAAKGQPENNAVSATVAQVKQVASQLLSSPSAVENERDAQKNLRALQDAARPLNTWWLRQNTTDIRALRLNRTLLWLAIDSLPERNAEQITPLRNLPKDKLENYRDRLAKGEYADLLAELEGSIARAPFWLDGQHMAWECLQGLGAEAAMLEVELQCALFLHRVPGIVELRFHDGSPFADPATRSWISAHVLPHLQTVDAAPTPTSGHDAPAWEQALQEAQAILRKDGLKAATQHLKHGLQSAHGGRQRFFWQLAMARLCYHAKKYELARIQLENLDQDLQDSGLHAWEPDLVLQVLNLLHSCCELLPQNHSVRERKDEVHRRLCHLDLEVVLD